jgi:hypothetical protein
VPVSLTANLEQLFGASYSRCREVEKVQAILNKVLSHAHGSLNRYIFQQADRAAFKSCNQSLCNALWLFEVRERPNNKCTCADHNSYYEVEVRAHNATNASPDQR